MLVLGPELMLESQIAFFGQLCHSERMSRPTSSSGNFLKGPGLTHGDSSRLAFVRHLSLLPDDSLHRDILCDIADARGPLPCANWARGIEMNLTTLAMASPFIFSG